LTQEQKETVKDMWQVKGLSLKQIGELFGKSRSAIAGIVSRNGWQKRAPEGFQHQRPKRNARRTVRPTKQSAVQATGAPVPPSPVAPLHLKLEETRAGRCMYPYHGEQYTFCGHKTIDGSSYCEHHHKVCYIAGSRRAF